MGSGTREAERRGLPSDDGGPGGGLPLEGWVRVQFLATAGLAAVSFMAGFWSQSSSERWVGFGWVAGVLAGLLLAETLRTLILDVLAEFQYRERFASFLVHVVALFVPRLVLGLEGLEHALGALAVLIAFHAVRREHFGRLLGVFLLLMVLGYARQDAPPAGLVPLWLGLYVLGARALHVRLLLEEHRVDEGPERRFEMRQLAWPLLGGAAVATTVWLVLAPRLSRRVLEFQPQGTPQPEGAPTIGPVSISGALMDAIYIVLMIIALFALVAWLEKKFRFRRRGSESELPEGALRSRVLAAEAVEAPPELDTEGLSPRQRIIEAFRHFAARAGLSGRGRAPWETARAFTMRVAEATERRSEATTAAGMFDRACYSHETVTHEDAARYEVFIEKEVELAAESVEGAGGREGSVEDSGR